jgi:nicotinate-nucleotide adenylyltransferase
VTTAAPEPVGLLGGSFDPIHAGHLRLARHAMQQLQLGQVRFIPAGQPWQKAAVAVTAAEHRLRMVQLSIDGQPGFAVDTVELQRPGPSYTVDTLQHLRDELGAGVALVLLLGADQFERLDTWHDWPRLFDLAHLAVARRDAAARPLAAHAPLGPELAALCAGRLQPAQRALRTPAGAIVELDMAPFECSSTQIRALVRDGGEQCEARLAELLAPGVPDYIHQHRLYA